MGERKVFERDLFALVNGGLYFVDTAKNMRIASLDRIAADDIFSARSVVSDSQATITKKNFRLYLDGQAAEYFVLYKYIMGGYNDTH